MLTLKLILAGGLVAGAATYVVVENHTNAPAQVIVVPDYPKPPHWTKRQIEEFHSIEHQADYIEHGHIGK